MACSTFFLLLALVVFALLGRDNWKVILTRENVIIALAGFGFALGWAFLDGRWRRNSNQELPRRRAT